MIKSLEKGKRHYIENLKQTTTKSFGYNQNISPIKLSLLYLTDLLNAFIAFGSSGFMITPSGETTEVP